MAKGGKGKKTQQRKDRPQEGNGSDGGGEPPEPLGDNLLGLGSIPNDAAVQNWVGSSATMVAARQDRFSGSGREDHDEFFPAPEWGSPGPATAKGGGGGGWDLASSIGHSGPHSGASSAMSTPMKRAIAGNANDGSSIRSGNGPSKMRGANMLSTVHEVQTVSSPTSNRTSLASGNANAGLATFAAAGNSLVINSPPVERKSRTSVEVKASSPAPSSFHPTSMAFSNTGPAPMPALMMTTGPIQPNATGGSHLQFAPTPSTITRHRELGGATSPHSGSDRSSHHTGSVIYANPGPVLVQSPSPISPTQDLGGGGKTVATMMQVSYSGGGPSTSVVGLMGSQSNGLQVFVPPGSNVSNNGSRVVSVASSQRPVSMKDTRRVASSPSIHSHHYAEASTASQPQVAPPIQVGMSSSYHGHESVAGLSIHTGPFEKVKGKDRGEVPGAWTSTSGGGQGVMNGHTWDDWEDDGGATPSRAQSQAVRTNVTGQTTDSEPYQPPLSAPPTMSQPKFPAPPRPRVLRSMVMQRAMSDTEYPPRPPPTHDARVQETGGLGLKPVQRAFFGRHRHASERFIWNLGPEHDERVEGALDWVERMGWTLANLGLNKFLSWRQRGALFANADFRPWTSPEEPGFDWMTFDEVQNTLDKTLQESIATYDPATTALVFVFLPSKSGSSVAIWRKKVNVPTSLQLKHNIEIQRIKRNLADGPKPVIKVERAMSAREAAPISPPPPILDKAGKKKKKRKWWQFWKSSRDDEEVVMVAGRENMRPVSGATRGRLAKRR